ncbi:MAG TPA: right-handed parallel beta-helix repeat-containing protein [Nocardioidaceae bacterium]|nr:right-handed parallel beta-helix repeat-containing protein [Nocardioidaceae bacterium]
MRSTRTRVVLVLVALLAGLLGGGAGLAAPAGAHEEREASFPDGTGKRPVYLGLDNPRQRVVCRPDSRERIAEMPAGPLKRRNRALLRECGYRSIQTAVNSIRKPRTSVYVLPGRYTESRWARAAKSDYCSNLGTDSDDPLPLSSYIGSLSSPDTGADDTGPIALSYADQRRCPHNLNLIAILGDTTPGNASMKCDGPLCGTQIVGTGRRRTDVLIDNRFAKLNAIRADRADGVYFRNFTVQQAEFNALYVLETDGFVVDRVVARGNDEYGILAFASDHGLIQRVDAYWNGDSGIYPGSASDVNGENEQFEPTRYSIEIRHSKSHHNALGYSGTAGNSVWAHHNRFFKNATGIATDSLFPGHPGLPQDHARWNDNLIYSNNENYYERYVDTGVCAKPMKERGYMKGTVCPVIPTPVGTGVLIAGGNFNSTDRNHIFDNWRYGTMQFWVPSPLRDEYDPSKLYDTSNGNRTFDNKMGLRPDGSTAHNGLDHWWDDQGVGNCWEDNKSSREGGVPTTNFAVDPGACEDGGSQFVPGLPVKDAGFLSCSQYDRNDPTWRHPPMCEWFESPEKPTDEQSDDPLGLAAPAGPSGPMSPLGGPTTVGALGASLAGVGLVLLMGLSAVRRRGLATPRG